MHVCIKIYIDFDQQKSYIWIILQDEFDAMVAEDKSKSAS